MEASKKVHDSSTSKINNNGTTTTTGIAASVLVLAALSSSNNNKPEEAKDYLHKNATKPEPAVAPKMDASTGSENVQPTAATPTQSKAQYTTNATTAVKAAAHPLPGPVSLVVIPLTPGQASCSTVATTAPTLLEGLAEEESWFSITGGAIASLSTMSKDTNSTVTSKQKLRDPKGELARLEARVRELKSEKIAIEKKLSKANSTISKLKRSQSKLLKKYNKAGSNLLVAQGTISERDARIRDMKREIYQFKLAEKKK